MFVGLWAVSASAQRICRRPFFALFQQRPSIVTARSGSCWLCKPHLWSSIRGVIQRSGKRRGVGQQPVRALMDSFREAKKYVSLGILLVFSFWVSTRIAEPRLTGMLREHVDAAVVVAFCTVPDVMTGERIAQTLLSSRLVACVNIVPTVQSMYWWEDKIQNDKESLLIIKTRPALQAAVTEAIQKAHPYEVPEVLFLPVQGGLAAYLEWVQQMTPKTS